MINFTRLRVNLFFTIFFGQIFFDCANAQTVSIPPKFDYADSFSDGVAHVSIGKKDYFIDKSGRIAIVPEKFDHYSEFSEGLAAVRNYSSKREGFIDKTGKVAIPLKYSSVQNFKEGRAVVSFSPLGTITAENGVIDRQGRYIRNPHLEYIFDFNEGYATANFGIIGQPTVGMIDRDGRSVMSGRFIWMSSLTEGVAAALAPNAGWGLIRADGSWSVPPKFDWLGNIGQGLIAFGDCGGRRWLPWFYGKQSCRYGFINRLGEIIISAQFTFVGTFRENRAVVSFSEDSNIGFDAKNRHYSSVGNRAKFGYIDPTGRLIIDPIYLLAGDFSEDVAVVASKEGSKADKKYGYIDLNGQPVSGFDYLFAGTVSEGLAAVMMQNKMWGYIRFK